MSDRVKQYCPRCDLFRGNGEIEPNCVLCRGKGWVWADEVPTRQWSKVTDRRYESTDGCVVCIDRVAETCTAKPWLPNYRGWIAYGPGDNPHNYLGFKRRNTWMNIPRKFKTPKAAMGGS